jgi:hypothetical protein
MPMQSKAQNAAMHAAAQGESTLGIPASVGKEFVKAQHGKPLKGLPEHVKKPKKGPFTLKREKRKEKEEAA